MIVLYNIEVAAGETLDLSDLVLTVTNSANGIRIKTISGAIRSVSELTFSNI